jgi:hypothetical protein
MSQYSRHVHSAIAQKRDIYIYVLSNRNQRYTISADILMAIFTYGIFKSSNYTNLFV